MLCHFLQETYSALMVEVAWQPETGEFSPREVVREMVTLDSLDLYVYVWTDMFKALWFVVTKQ